MTEVGRSSLVVVSPKWNSVLLDVELMVVVVFATLLVLDERVTLTTMGTETLLMRVWVTVVVVLDVVTFVMFTPPELVTGAVE